MKYEFNISGMMCAGCQQNIQKAVAKIKGVKRADVNLVSNTMSVECQDSVTAQNIIDQVKRIGYGASERTPDASNRPNC